MALSSHDMAAIGADLLTRAAAQAARGIENQRPIAALPFRIVAPGALERATAQKDHRTDARPVMQGEVLYLKYIAGDIRQVQIVFHARVSPFRVRCG